MASATLRATGDYTSVEQILDTVVRDEANARVYLRDVARVEHGLEKLNFIPNIKKKFNFKHLGIDLLKNVAKVAVVGWVVALALKEEANALGNLALMSIHAAAHTLLAAAARVVANHEIARLDARVGRNARRDRTAQR